MRAVVIGAGIGGIAAAIAMRCAGLEVEVHERAGELREVGAGIGLWPNALRVLDRIGLGDAVRVAALPLSDACVFAWNGEPMVQVSLDGMRDRGAWTVVLHRATLLELLITALGRERVRLGRLCTGFDQDSQGVVAKFSGGERAPGDFLIGADGLYSAVRAQLWGDRKPLYAGYTAWRGVVRFDHTRLMPGETWGAGARFGQFPMADGQVYWFACMNAPEHEHSPMGEKAALREVFGRFHDPIPELIEATEERTILRNDICDRPPLRRWGHGRVTLLGDAAHPMTPNLGQGACQALEDALVLAECVNGGSDVPSALRRYEKRRMARANAMVIHSRRFGSLAQLEHPLLIAARNAIMRRIPQRMRARGMEAMVGF